jgi:hypothetical protein
VVYSTHLRIAGHARRLVAFCEAVDSYVIAWKRRFAFAETSVATMAIAAAPQAPSHCVGASVVQ